MRLRKREGCGESWLPANSLSLAWCTVLTGLIWVTWGNSLMTSARLRFNAAWLGGLAARGGTYYHIEGLICAVHWCYCRATNSSLLHPPCELTDEVINRIYTMGPNCRSFWKISHSFPFVIPFWESCFWESFTPLRLYGENIFFSSYDFTKK